MTLVCPKTLIWPPMGQVRDLCIPWAEWMLEFQCDTAFTQSETALRKSDTDFRARHRFETLAEPSTAAALNGERSEILS
jgi:hypothetical protein